MVLKFYLYFKVCGCNTLRVHWDFSAADTPHRTPKSGEETNEVRPYSCIFRGGRGWGRRKVQSNTAAHLELGWQRMLGVMRSARCFRWRQFKKKNSNFQEVCFSLILQMGISVTLFGRLHNATFLLHGYASGWKETTDRWVGGQTDGQYEDFRLYASSRCVL